MPKNTSSRFIQNKASQAIIFFDETTLLSNRVARWWGNTPYDYISYFTFRMAANNMNELCCSHRIHLVKF